MSKLKSRFLRFVGSSWSSKSTPRASKKSKKRPPRRKPRRGRPYRRPKVSRILIYWHCRRFGVLPDARRLPGDFQAARRRYPESFQGSPKRPPRGPNAGPRDLQNASKTTLKIKSRSFKQSMNVLPKIHVFEVRRVILEFKIDPKSFEGD